jgi:hypothetical protein
MITLTLVVALSQYAPPPAAFDTQPEPELGNAAWSAVPQAVGGIGFALAGRRLVAELVSPHQMFPDDRGSYLELAGLLVGSMVGYVAGYVAGYFARRGSTPAKIAAIAISVLGAGAIAFQGYETVNDVQKWNFNLGGGLLPIY